MTKYIAGTSILRKDTRTSITHSIEINYKTEFTAYTDNELAKFKKRYTDTENMKLVLSNIKEILHIEIDKIEQALACESIIYLESEDE